MSLRDGRTAALSLLSLACASTMLIGTPAQAVPTHEGDHSMGSQIRKHEGGKSTDPVNAPADSVPGLDVSSHNGTVDWSARWDDGYKFAYVKATEGTSYTNPEFSGQYNGSYDVGMIRGAYHFAQPGNSSGADQASYFVEHGGGWSDDGKTLPGALDMEYNPNGETCYGLSPEEMGDWVSDFNETYKSKTGRYPVIYTSTSWWSQCVSGDFGDKNPLWVARYADSVGDLPSGWSTHTIWQHSSDPFDKNKFNGSEDNLKKLAKG